MPFKWRFVVLPAGIALALAGCSQQKAADSPAAQASVTVPKPPAGDTDAQNSAFLAAAEPFENLTEQAPAASTDKLVSLIADAKKAAAGVSPALAAPAKTKLDTHLSDIALARNQDDRTGIALAAVEGYRTLVESAKDTGKVPRAVSLLDYAGFRYQADLFGKPARWDDMGKTVVFAEEQWAGIANVITDKALKADFAKAVTDMRAAVNSHDEKAARAAATHELDLVDRLEGFFSKQ